ncbi:MAG TPA: tetratricopeptide repeat protein [Aggregatilinea sp.]|uniref:tetratricopeptide repeat protein n=1 Tax=Aggregatilinea sp. TaxID=2806333 RepID=UPI002C6F1AED|nr:tetratricopeptide repeat protein [Aggregatilinea sp.]HML22806.1 tetratricopeptide repeat protein [Aggregatilinea sp.]
MGLSTTDLLSASKEFLDLYKAGKAAARQGDRAQAHELFRQAIEMDPYHEQVWLWLASVVDSDEDKRVCFENVLELNPSNPTARQHLQRIAEKEAVAEVRRMMTTPAPDLAPAPQTSWLWNWTRRLLMVITLSAVTIIAITALNVLL